MPIVVGGTGMYLRALMRGLADLPGADPVLRAELDARPLADLQRQLSELDPTGAAQLDLKNPRRVVRALEVCLLTGRPFSSFRAEWSAGTHPARGVALTFDRATLLGRIDRRAAAMFEAGVAGEVAGCSEIGPTAGQVLGLSEVRAHLRGELSREQCVGALAQATRQYAKRQMTWLRREPALAAHNLSDGDADALIHQIAEQARATITAAA